MAQKSILSILQSVAVELNLPVPQYIVSSTDQNVIKLFNLFKAVCDDLIIEYDWQQLHTRYTFNTVDGQDSYDMPTDLQKFISGTFYNSTQQWAVPGSLTPVQWSARLNNVALTNSPFDTFRVYQNKFFISPTPGSTVFTFNFEYISNSYVKDSITHALKPEITLDTDICLFDHRICVYGTKLKWQASLQQDTTNTFIEFNRALEFAKGYDVPAETLHLGGPRNDWMITTANFPDWNWTV